MTSDLEFRFAVGDRHGRKSTIWKIVSTRNDVYAFHRELGGIQKITFHGMTRKCHRAFTQRHPSMPGRFIEQWTRDDTPLPGQEEMVRVLTMIFPEGHLSPDLPTAGDKPVLWLDPPARGAARYVQILFSRDNLAEVERLFEAAEHQLVRYHPLPSGEAVVIRSWEEPWPQPDIIMPAALGRSADIILPAAYQTENARPGTLTWFRLADNLVCLELTGFPVPAGEARPRFPEAHIFWSTAHLEIKDGEPAG